MIQPAMITAKNNNAVLSVLVFLFFVVAAAADVESSVVSSEHYASKDAESTLSNLNKDANHSNFTVFGYLPEWRYEGANYKTLTTHLTHLILFSLEPTSDGRIVALDRLPSLDILEEIHDASREGVSNCQILICFGGNGRSNGFSQMVRSSKARSNFVQHLIQLCDTYKFHGVDYNWEYPGYIMGHGYQSKSQIKADYEGLAKLVTETRHAFYQYNNKNNLSHNHNKDDEQVHVLSTITMAYYPDTRQEQLLFQYGISDVVDYMHSMSYDQNGNHHSSLEFGKQTVHQAEESQLPVEKVTLGLPFYGRYVESGDWVTYEDIVQQHHPLDPNVDQVKVNTNIQQQRRQMSLAFNGLTTISEKTKYALEHGLGGVMIWEAGQDCRIEQVTRHEQTHVVTCPNGSESSLLAAITKALPKEKNDGSNDNRGSRFCKEEL